jgi:hypothetical protein
MPNFNTETGHPFSVIAGNSLKGDLLHDLMVTSGKDLTYEAAYNEAKVEAGNKYDSLREKYEQQAIDNGASGDEAIEDAIDTLMSADPECHHESDKDLFIDQELERFSDTFSCDEPVIEGKLDGVSYQVTWLGGAILVWSFDGPLAMVRSLCSPCVPGAADLDSGFVLDEEDTGNDEEKQEIRKHGHLAHAIPRSWLATNEG